MSKKPVTARKPLFEKDPDEHGRKVKIVDKDGKQKARECSMDYDFGDNIKESVDLFGEAPVHSAFVQASIVSLQGLIRSGLDRDEAPASIVARLATWKPGVTMPRMADPVSTLKAQFASGTMTEEDKRAKIADLIAAAGLKKV